MRNFAANDNETILLNNNNNNNEIGRVDNENNQNVDGVVPMEVEKQMEQDEAEISEAISNIAKKKREAKKSIGSEEKKSEEKHHNLDNEDDIINDEDGLKTPEIKEEDLLYKTKSAVEQSPSKFLGVRRLSSSLKSPLIVRSNSLTTLLANNNNSTTSSEEIKQLLAKNENLN